MESLLRTPSDAERSAKQVATAMKVFISYRRKDSQHITDRLYDQLVARLGKNCIFKDVDSVPLGVDFRQAIETAIDESQVLFAVIGQQWLRASDEVGNPRLEKETDIVRVEIETALRKGVSVVPVLVDGATMPREEQLPSKLQPLAFRNGISVRPDPDFQRDLDRLLKMVPERTRRRTIFLLSALAAAVLLVAIVFYAASTGNRNAQRSAAGDLLSAPPEAKNLSERANALVNMYIAKVEVVDEATGTAIDGAAVECREIEDRRSDFQEVIVDLSSVPIQLETVAVQGITFFALPLDELFAGGFSRRYIVSATADGFGVGHSEIAKYPAQKEGLRRVFVKERPLVLQPNELSGRKPDESVVVKLRRE